MKLRIAPLLVCLITVCQAVVADVFVPYTDPSFQYEGRVGMTASEGAEIYWPSSGVQFRIDSPSMTLHMQDTKGVNYFNLIVDGKLDEATVIALKEGKNEIPVDLGSDGPKLVTITKRSDTFFGKSAFDGIDIPDNAKMLTPPERPAHRIEFYGDSITSGMGNLAPEDAKDQGQDVIDNAQAYGAITARNLNAEYRCISRSGIGIMVSWFPLTMPEMYNRTDPQAPDSQWDFSQWTPDVVVINLFQNDSWLYKQTKRIDPTPTPDDIVAAYKDFVESIRKEYPDAHIVCTLGSMDATREGSPWPGYVEKAVDELKAEGDSNLSVVFFPFDGFKKHPRVKHHQRNADILTAHIQEQMGW